LCHQRIDGAQRFQLLEVLRPVVLDGMALLERQLQGTSFPLSTAKAQAAGQLQSLHVLLSLGYRQAVAELCGPSGSVPFLRGGVVARAVERALYHGSRQLALAYFLYRAPAAGVWRGLHAIDAFARSVSLQHKPVEDIALRHPASVESGYGQAVLLALSNPYRFSQREQADLWQATRDLAELCSFHSGQPPEGAFAVPQDDDEGPGYIPEERARAGAQLLWFDLAPLARHLDESLGSQTTGEVLLRPRKGHTVLAQAELLRRLRSGWGQAAARGHQRMGAVHSLETVVGLSGLHYFLAGHQDFDSFLRRLRDRPLPSGGERAAWAQGSDGGSVAVATARVLDQSLGGYRLEWPPAEQVRARVGELIGLAVGGDDDARDWMVGVVRWLRYGPVGGVHAGVELLARRGTAVAVRCLDGPTALGARPTLRAVELDALREDQARLRFVVPGVLDANARQIEITRPEGGNDGFDHRDDPEPEVQRTHRVRVLENAGDYMLLASEEAGA